MFSDAILKRAREYLAVGIWEPNEIETLAALLDAVTSDEREACAKVVEEDGPDERVEVGYERDIDVRETCRAIARRIRERAKP